MGTAVAGLGIGVGTAFVVDGAGAGGVKTAVVGAWLPAVRACVGTAVVGSGTFVSSGVLVLTGIAVGATVGFTTAAAWCTN